MGNACSTCDSGHESILPAEDSLVAAMAAAKADATELRPADEPRAQSPGYERTRHSRKAGEKVARQKFPPTSENQTQHEALARVPC